MAKIKFLKSTSANRLLCPGSFDFDNTDDRKSFKKVQKKFPHLIRPIKYTLNSNGYRCPEFNSINWKESVVTLGCSHTYGVGVDDKETYSSLLEKEIGMPVINLGMGGWSIWQIVHNARILASLEPKHVILQVPNAERFAIFLEDGSALSIGSWTNISFFRTYNSNDYSPKLYQTFALDYLDKLLGNIIFSFSFSPSSLAEHIPIIDRGRDNLHPGPDTHRSVADRISSLF